MSRLQPHVQSGVTSSLRITWRVIVHGRWTLFMALEGFSSEAEAVSIGESIAKEAADGQVTLTTANTGYQVLPRMKRR